EISSFFLTPGEDFAYFEGKHQPKALLDVPKIPEQYHYKGPIVILVNKESGSASELFSGVMQSRGRATLMGTSTAGKVLLKSMFNFEDQSMLLLVTAAGHFPDGRMFSFEGLSVDRKVEEEKADWVNLAALYLASLKKSE
ncbi:MAG TPA: S41 family peptidase, partial [Candidatus Omnitrophota bacterium]|nr:S41 family peptidase [Candidatus Omnitrophota bacterium]